MLGASVPRRARHDGSLGVEHPESAGIRFARGVRALIGARDVFVCRAPIAPAKDCESIYFHVNEEGGKRTILQVVFEQDRAVTAVGG